VKLTLWQKLRRDRPCRVELELKRFTYVQRASWFDRQLGIWYEAFACADELCDAFSLACGVGPFPRRITLTAHARCPAGPHVKILAVSRRDHHLELRTADRQHIQTYVYDAATRWAWHAEITRCRPYVTLEIHGE
jgi:hypothetical protein